MKYQLKEEHEYFGKQFKLMTNLLTDMQNKCDYFFNTYNSQLDRMESKIQYDPHSMDYSTTGFSSSNNNMNDQSFVSVEDGVTSEYS